MTNTRPAWLSPALMIAIAALALAYAPRPHDGLTQPVPNFAFPAELITQAMPLDADQIRWFTLGGAESAVRLRFEWRGLTGSMILITSATWRAQHRPERCFEVYGLTPNDSHTHLIAPDFPVRIVSLTDRSRRGLLAATYWFQSAERTTDDYGTRMWADLAPTRERWILVTILFDRVLDSDATEVQALYLALRDSVARNLKGELLP
jgi:exosortase O